MIFSLKNNIKRRPKISIFLPIYNQENYINKSIQSIQNQTLKDIEIIAVNDQSNDNTLKILKDLSKNDDRIKIVNNQNNHGLLYSRGMGILNSYGEYIMNLDPDDEFFGNDSLEYLYNQFLIKDVDIITFDVFYEQENRIIKCRNNNRIQKQPELFTSIFKENNRIEDYLIWNKIIKKEIFKKSFRAFKKEIYNGKWNYFEDDIWSILVNKFSKTKLCMNKLVYIHKYNKNSLMNKRFGLIEFQNVLYRHEMYKKLFSTKKYEKYLVAEYYFLLNRLQLQIKHLLLINDKDIKHHINKIFLYFLKNYKCSVAERNDINNFLKLIN